MDGVEKLHIISHVMPNTLLWQVAMSINQQCQLISVDRERGVEKRERDTLHATSDSVTTHMSFPPLNSLGCGICFPSFLLKYILQCEEETTKERTWKLHLSRGARKQLTMFSPLQGHQWDNHSKCELTTGAAVQLTHQLQRGLMKRSIWLDSICSTWWMGRQRLRSKSWGKTNRDSCSQWLH